MKRATVLALVIACVGCSTPPDPAKTADQFKAAWDNACRSALALCNAYEVLGEYDPETDAACVDVRAKCAPGVP